MRRASAQGVATAYDATTTDAKVYGAFLGLVWRQAAGIASPPQQVNVVSLGFPLIRQASYRAVLRRISVLKITVTESGGYRLLDPLLAVTARVPLETKEKSIQIMRAITHII